MEINNKIKLISVVDLGFPRRWAGKRGGRASNYFLPISSRKLHEIERKVGPRRGGGGRGGERVHSATLSPPNKSDSGWHFVCDPQCQWCSLSSVSKLARDIYKSCLAIFSERFQILFNFQPIMDKLKWILLLFCLCMLQCLGEYSWNVFSVVLN